MAQKKIKKSVPLKKVVPVEIDKVSLSKLDLNSGFVNELLDGEKQNSLGISIIKVVNGYQISIKYVTKDEDEYGYVCDFTIIKKINLQNLEQLETLLLEIPKN